MKLRRTFMAMLENLETYHLKAISKGWTSETRRWYIEKANEVVDMQAREVKFARAWPIPCARARKINRCLVYLERAQEVRDRLYAREPPVTAWSLVFGEHE